MSRNSNSASRFSGRGAVAKEIFLNPRRSFLNWFDNYFRNQSREFQFLVSLIVFLTAFGVVMVLSASNVDSIISSGDPFRSFAMQLLYAVLGLIAMFWISTRDIHQIQVLGMRIFAVSLITQVLVRVPGLGVSAGGNANWIRIGQFTIQPSEFLKIGLIVYLAALIAQNIENMWDWKAVGQPVLLWGFGSAAWVYITGNDLGTAGIIVVIVCAMVYLAGLPLPYFLRYMGITAAGLVIAGVSNPSRMIRIMTFLNQGSASNDGSDWQVKHGIWALASGNWTGTGLGQSKLNWGWIPEVENDFIFSSIGEQWGFLGSVVTLALFFLLFMLLRRVAITNGDPFVSLVTTGIMAWVILQTLVNIAVVLHLLPVLGVPLPLISRGGSSLISVLIALGVVLAFERNKQTVIPRRSKR